MNPLSARVEGLEDLVRALAEGRLKMHQLPPDLTAEEKAAVRRAALERMSGASLEHMGGHDQGDGHRGRQARRAADKNAEHHAQRPRRQNRPAE